jgi:hypothetical protein
MLEEMWNKLTSFAMEAFTLWIAFPGFKPLGQTLQSEFRQVLSKPCAVHNSVALVDLTLFFGQQLESLALCLVTRIDQPAVSLEKDGRTEVVLISSPPVRRARGRTASTQNADYQFKSKIKPYHS